MLKDDISKDDTESRCKVFLYVWIQGDVSSYRENP